MSPSDEGILRYINRTLAERLFGYQYAKEFIQEKRSREWVKSLPGVIAALNNEITRAINMKPKNTIKKVYAVASVALKTSQPHIVVDMTKIAISPVYGKLTRIFIRIQPTHYTIATRAVIILLLS